MSATDSQSTQTINSDLSFRCSRQFLGWLKDEDVSLVLSTYEVGKVFWIGRKIDDTLEVFNRTFNRSMGIFASSQTLYLSTLFQLWRFENYLDSGQEFHGYDRLYVPTMAWTTGDIDIHDIAVDRSGKPVFVSTLFSCLATVDERYSFKPLWKPEFVSRLAAEDRCHLNGFALVDDEPAYATSVSQSDITEGWREHKNTGGVVIDIRTNSIVAHGLSMPHSPRWHKGKLWLLNSGSGEFGYVDIENQRFEALTFCPGFARGLEMTGNYAVIGVSKPRSSNELFKGLELNKKLAMAEAVPRCGVLVVDIRTGDIVHSLEIQGYINELYDVGIIKGVARPMAVGLQTDEINRVLRMP